MPLQFIQSKRGKPQLVDAGFVYSREKPSGDKVIWVCVNYQKLSCKARVHTLDDDIVHRVNQHQHAPEPALIEAKRISQQVRARASATLDPTRVILADAVQGASPGAAALLSSEKAMKRTINRHRVEAVGAPINSRSLRDMVIPQEYCDIDGELFLQHDSGPGDDRILIFATADSLRLLSESPNWFADGTFDPAPELFCQVYTLHALVEDRSYPCVYALLPNKNRATYERFLECLKNIAGAPQFQPNAIMTDFELGAIRAFETVFPNASLSGCFFHLAQSCWRHVQSMKERYSGDQDFATCCRMLPALAFVPTQDVAQAFLDIVPTFPTELDDYVAYFERTYIGAIVAGRTRAPLFPPEFWNQHAATLDDLPRTNNAVEGWHRAFQGMVGCSHPTIWKLIKSMKREVSLQTFRLNQQVGGHAPPAKRRKYMDTDKRIKQRVQRYGGVNTVPYLRGLAHNVRF